MRAGETPASAVTRDEGCNAGNPNSMTAAQRQRAYRLRRKRAAIEGIGQEATASRVTLLSMLGHDLAAREASTTPESLIRPTRSSVKRILHAIVTRYGIEP
jgi:hypothetical protein